MLMHFVFTNMHVPHSNHPFNKFPPPAAALMWSENQSGSSHQQGGEDLMLCSSCFLLTLLLLIISFSLKPKMFEMKSAFIQKTLLLFSRRLLQPGLPCGGMCTRPKRVKFRFFHWLLPWRCHQWESWCAMCLTACCWALSILEQGFQRGGCRLSF